MMPGIWVVLVPVTPFPAAICPGELRTTERADLLVGLGDTEVQDLADVFDAIDSAGGPLEVRIVRGAESLALTVDVSGARS